ncbi:VanZ family protein [Streptomyces winkii]|uniref:VanZ family protein n=1 Tax=Streptomyces winkii TaxID=3051178 RepID=UPI0028D6571F|nr:VanZ family protein [Streptomyces sp. DSM 40971]
MAHTYLLPIKTAAALFPLLALLLLLPTAVVLYRRHGVMTSGRFLSLFGFVHYLLTAVCMTVVPLPSRAVNVCRQYAEMASPQLVPGNTVADVWKEAHHEVGLGALVIHNPAVAGAAFNLLLLVPLGVFLRYHFRRGLPATACAGFGLSLAFELTQWTGVWGLYDCPYRLFDVDDLAINTSGAVLGWALTGPVARLLPTLDTLDGKALSRVPVPFGRRLTALLVDLIGIAFTGAFCVVVGAFGGWWDDRGALLEVPLAVCALWFVVLPYATGGTPGKRLQRLCLVTEDGGPPAVWRLALRVALMAGVVLPLFSLLLAAGLILVQQPSPFALASRVWPADLEEAAAQAAWHIEEIVLAAGAVGLSALLPLTVLRHPRGRGLHERLSGVRNAALPPTRSTVPSSSRYPVRPVRIVGAAGQEGPLPWTRPARADSFPRADSSGDRRPWRPRQPRHARPKAVTLSVPPTPPGATRPWHRAPEGAPEPRPRPRPETEPAPVRRPVGEEPSRTDVNA